MSSKNKQPKVQYRFGIVEWYGRSFIHLSPAERRIYVSLSRAQQKEQPCIPRLAENPNERCNKKGGVCSLRLFQMSGQTVSPVSGLDGALRTSCPNRFKEEMKVFHWVGETILDTPDPIIIKEIGFLEKPRELVEGRGRKDDVGRIDMVLVHPDTRVFSWCALEMQAVYFSGDAMGKDFGYIARYDGNDLPFPAGKRRPDYRSSGPKRLMPQLQIKVPTLRRWGKKMAVIIDRSFFDEIGQMDRVKDISHCDIAWFVVKYEEKGTKVILEPDFVSFTTLEKTVEGLTGGTPVSLGEFERRIKRKLGKKS